jgi:hypothetical protein
MKHEEVAEVLAKPISRELLGSSIPARLAYVGIDGEPRVIPIAFLWTGQHVARTPCRSRRRFGHCGIALGWRSPSTLRTNGRPGRC